MIFPRPQQAEGEDVFFGEGMEEPMRRFLLGTGLVMLVALPVAADPAPAQTPAQLDASASASTAAQMPSQEDKAAVKQSGKAEVAANAAASGDKRKGGGIITDQELQQKKPWTMAAMTVARRRKGLRHEAICFYRAQHPGHRGPALCDAGRCRDYRPPARDSLEPIGRSLIVQAIWSGLAARQHKRPSQECPCRPDWPPRASSVDRPRHCAHLP